MAKPLVHAPLPGGEGQSAMCGARPLLVMREGFQVTPHIEHVTCDTCLSGVLQHAYAIMGIALSGLANKGKA